jgi:hypothetical protein
LKACLYYGQSRCDAMGIHGEGTISSVVGLTYFMTLIAKGAHNPAEGAMVPTAQYGFLYNGDRA